ncbi:MAG TPA: hypothetical protein DCS66_21015 [Flavobacteriaceae bacterium]|nr:hypothetical protein [Flavobacteriaceae bacterium]|tara:strand:- start:1013 stop:1879 length:867 start_codon:yes stop_codon:yes gene_type:complete
MNTVSIASSAVQIDLNISVWTARKLDRKVSEEIDGTKKTNTRAGNYNKHLLAGTKQLKDIQSLTGEIRNWHLRQTLPWSDNGTRLLPMKNFFKYKEQLTEYQHQFDTQVKQLVDDYPQLISLSAYNLGELFDRDDYPPTEEIESKFNLGYTIIPVPEAGDFRVDIGNDIRQELETQYEDAYQQKVETAMSSAWSRLHTTLENMVTKLADPRWNEEDAKNPQVYDSFIGHGMELTSLLTSLNITDDHDLEQARIGLEQALAGVQPDMIKNQPYVREKLLKDVQSIKDLI